MKVKTDFRLRFDERPKHILLNFEFNRKKKLFEENRLI